ncbi:MAG: hypothetical protein WB764_06045 [Xanthobacteraceae bacterium]
MTGIVFPERRLAWFQLELGLFAGQKFRNLRSLDRILLSAGKPSISLGIFSGDNIVHRSLP